MSSPSRIVTSTFVSYEADTSRRLASLVVAAVDDFTNEPPRAVLRVALKEQPRRAPARNPSGHHVFFDLADGDYTLVVEPDPVNADWFFLRPAGSDPWTTAFERTVTLPKANPLSPLERIVLTPKATYPFPAGTTLVLGSVSQGTARVPLAVVTTSYERVKADDPEDTEPVDLVTATDRAGFFVLSFHSLNKKTQDIEVTATLGAASVTTPVSITEGKTAMTALVLP